MKLLLNTHVSNDYDGCGYAFVDLTPEFARAILQRFGIFQYGRLTDPNIASVEFDDTEAMFCDGLPETLAELLDDGSDYKETTAEDSDFENYVAYTVCDRMVICNDSFYWTCYPKHSDASVETAPIPYDLARKVAHTE
jgi:hypothetical protein